MNSGHYLAIPPPKLRLAMLSLKIAIFTVQGQGKASNRLPQHIHITRHTDQV